MVFKKIFQYLNLSNFKKIIKFFSFIIFIITFIIIFFKYYNMNYINKSISIIVLITSFISFLNNSKYKKIIILKLLELKSEIKKIKWPNIQETLYMTLFIILISTIVSIILWSLDNIIMHLISYLTSLTIPLQDF